MAELAQKQNKGTINVAFLQTLGVKTKQSIVSNIASHYGIRDADVMDEVSHDQAEFLFEYMVGPQRSATYLLMVRHSADALCDVRYSINSQETSLCN